MIELEVCEATQSVSYLHYLGVAVRKSSTQLHRVGLRPGASSLMMSLEGTVVLNAEQESKNNILT